jgi:predicted RNA-binding Zn-ribbon protein involved in translation (DUF1610 family)
MATHPYERPRKTEFCCPGCGARILAVPVKVEGVRYANYRAMEDFGEAKAGQAIARCPRCHRGLPPMTWAEFRDRVGEGFAP